GGGGQERRGSENQATLSDGGGECHGPSQSQSGGSGDEEPGVGKDGRQRVHAEVAGDGALKAVAVEAAEGEGEGRHQGEESEDGGRSGGGSDKIAAAGHLPLFAGFLAPPRGCLFGLVGFRHKSVASCQLPVASTQRSANCQNVFHK